MLLAVGWGNLIADGMIVIPQPPSGNPFPLSVTYHNVKVKITDQTATTRIEQEFHNPTRRRLEGYYLFPVPENAVIEHFSAQINGKMTTAELLPADKARQYYENIVRKLLDPALLEYSNQGLYRMRIFPIQPDERKKVTITYRELLTKDFDRIEYLYPLNTEKFSSEPLDQVSVHIELESNSKLSNIICPTHNVDIVHKTESSAILSYEAENVLPNRDLRCFFQVEKSELGLSLFIYRQEGEDGFFMLAASPALQSTRVIPKDITFVLDVSGSMQGDKIEQAKKALLYCIDHLNPGDRFEIIRFSTEAYGLFNRCVQSNRQNRTKARRFVNDLETVGGTNMEAAFSMALQNTGNERPHLVLFITDGKPTIGETDEAKLLAPLENQKTRIFALGIGYEVNTHLLDHLAEKSRATRRYISPDEDLQQSIASFYDKIKSPALTRIDIDFGRMDAYQYYPYPVPDLFKGSSLTLLGRFRNTGACEIILSGDYVDKPKTFRLKKSIQTDTRHDFLPVLWASRRVGYLLGLVRTKGEEKEIIDEIIHLSRTYGIVTPYTSYLILEDEVNQPPSRNELLTYGNMPVFRQSAPAQINEERHRMQQKSGKGSVEQSEEVYNLHKADQVGAGQQGKERLLKAGQSQIINQRKLIVNKAGRAFYQSDAFWIDSYLQTRDHQKKIRIQFGTGDYFGFLKAHPEQAPILALGKNVRFYMNEHYYEIYE